MNQTFDIILFLILGFGWVVTWNYAVNLKKKREIYKKREISIINIAIDAVFLSIGAYSAYIIALREIIMELKNGSKGPLEFLFLVLVIILIYGGTLILFGYATRMREYFLYSVRLLLLYMILVEIIFQIRIGVMPNIYQFLGQYFAIARWAFAILFPLDIGNILHDIKLFKNQHLNPKELD